MPAAGHFDPLTPIAVHFADCGHDVRWYAGPEYAPKVERLGMSAFPYERATEITADNLNDLFPERTCLKGPKQISFDLEKSFVSNVEKNFLDLVDIRDAFEFDVLICDGGFYAEKLVADRIGIRVFARARGVFLNGCPGLEFPTIGRSPMRSSSAICVLCTVGVPQRQRSPPRSWRLGARWSPPRREPSTTPTLPS